MKLNAFKIPCLLGAAMFFAGGVWGESLSTSASITFVEPVRFDAVPDCKAEQTAERLGIRAAHSFSEIGAAPAVFVISGMPQGMEGVVSLAGGERLLSIKSQQNGSTHHFVTPELKNLSEAERGDIQFILALN